MLYGTCHISQKVRIFVRLLSGPLLSLMPWGKYKWGTALSGRAMMTWSLFDLAYECTAFTAGGEERVSPERSMVSYTKTLHLVRSRPDYVNSNRNLAYQKDSEMSIFSFSNYGYFSVEHILRTIHPLVEQRREKECYTRRRNIEHEPRTSGLLNRDLFMLIPLSMFTVFSGCVH